MLLQTETGKSFVSHEVPPKGYTAITEDTTDEEIDRRIQEFGVSIDHAMGSCAMGRVVDKYCRVKGLTGLRIVDASVFPVPLPVTFKLLFMRLLRGLRIG